jgi:DNA-binding CsgD family transcriptional regulator
MARHAGITAKVQAQVTVRLPDYAKAYPSLPDRMRDIVHWLDVNLAAAGYAFMIERIDRQVAERQAEWAGRFGLTPAEMRLALHLMNGGTVASYTKANGVSRNTVRNQLQAVYCKTGTHRQAELVALLLQN